MYFHVRQSVCLVTETMFMCRGPINPIYLYHIYPSPAMISGNVAYLKRTVGSTGFRRGTPPSLAVDGNRNPDHGSGSCAYILAYRQYRLNWGVDLGRPHVIYNLTVYGPNWTAPISMLYAFMVTYCVNMIMDSACKSKLTKLNGVNHVTLTNIVEPCWHRSRVYHFNYSFTAYCYSSHHTNSMLTKEKEFLAPLFSSLISLLNY